MFTMVLYTIKCYHIGHDTASFMKNAHGVVPANRFHEIIF